jgi:flavin reductase (DIM6/NTAB) family NADH-FMN oxidoreductase RutF
MKHDLFNVTHLMPCSVVLLSATSGDKKDAMTATSMFVNEDPSLFMVSVAKHILTHQLIEESGEFVLNVASEEQVKLAKALGATHGIKVDKFKKFHITTGKARKVGAPLLKGSFAHLECKVITSTSLGKNTLFLAEVVDYQYNEKLVPLAWQADRYFALKKAVI